MREPISPRPLNPNRLRKAVFYRLTYVLLLRAGHPSLRCDELRRDSKYLAGAHESDTCSLTNACGIRYIQHARACHRVDLGGERDAFRIDLIQLFVELFVERGVVDTDR